MQKAIRLSDLIMQGRDARHEISRKTNHLPEPPPPVEAVHQQAIVDGIELLAVELLSLSKLRKHNPSLLMREALRSIDSCLMSIGRHG